MSLKFKAHKRNERGHLFTLPVILEGCVHKEGFADKAIRIVPDQAKIEAQLKECRDLAWSESKAEHQREPLDSLRIRTEERNAANRKIAVLEADLAAANLAIEAARGQFWSGLFWGVVVGAFGAVVASAIFRAVS